MIKGSNHLRYWGIGQAKLKAAYKEEESRPEDKQEEDRDELVPNGARKEVVS